VSKQTDKGFTKATILKASAAEDSLVGKLNSALQKSKAIQGLIEVPFDPKTLARLEEQSSILAQHVEAITTNVDQFGWKYEPAVKFDAPDIVNRVKEAIYTERISIAEETGKDPKSVPLPTDKEVSNRLEELQWISKVELNKLKAFFAVCYPEGSFIDLRSKTTKNKEMTGNAYWEVLRDGAGRVSRLVLAPCTHMRLAPIDAESTDIQERVPTSEMSWRLVPQKYFFRRFAEISNDQRSVKIWFKEFGDPRFVSRLTGKYYKNEAEFNADPLKPQGDGPATEIIHFKLYVAASDPYGAPRWIGNLPAVLGSRELDEVNLGYFENKTVPPLALLVAGGRLSKGVVPRIEEFIEQNIKGKKNYHKILILEAEGQKSAGQTNALVPTVKFVPLRESQQQDALFQAYDEANWQKVGSSFRLPRILVGRDRQINRSTSESSLRFAEEQVFEPLRNTFDELINRKLFAALGITFWRFRTNTPVTRDPITLSAIIKEQSDGGALTPADARALLRDVFNKDLDQIDALWVRQPLKLSVAEARKQGSAFDDEDQAATAAQNLEDLNVDTTAQAGSEDSSEAPAIANVDKRSRGLRELQEFNGRRDEE
jgi:PBSX family phage portal protein